jgi:hypothetical protein
MSQSGKLGMSHSPDRPVATGGRHEQLSLPKLDVILAAEESPNDIARFETPLAFLRCNITSRRFPNASFQYIVTN